ncbi:MAG TPA: hypothetical protein VGL56_07295 [Fimbriimonadaceae bacterium]|jgi:hypothetical protein
MTPRAALVPLSLAIALASNAQHNQKVRDFVQRFYDWYTPIASGHDKIIASDYVIEQKSSLFTSRLLRALKDDSQAEANDKSGYTVGLDFDPFMASQDPDKHYKVGGIRTKGHAFWLDLHRVVSGKIDAEVVVIAEVIQTRGQYQFADFFYPRPPGQDLLTVLKRLKKDREGRHH